MDYEISNIPSLETAEELLQWLIERFETLKEQHGLLILSGDDVADLLAELWRFQDERARTGVQNKTDNKGGII